jgi:SnoaL-like domain
MRLAVEAFNRRDLDAFQLGWHPDCEFHPPREFVDAGHAEPCYRGAAGYRDYLLSVAEAWGDSAQVEPVELIDLADRLLLLGACPRAVRPAVSSSSTPPLGSST